MVGVAGRSKGCLTCRKRKKGCDLQQPECGQCKERGIRCGGYDIDRIFIYQKSGYNIQGTPNTRRNPKSVATDNQDAPPSVRVGPLLPQAQNSPIRPLAVSSGNRSPSPMSANLSKSLSRSAFGEKTMEAFLYMYIPGGDINSTNDEGKGFVQLLPALRSQDRALQMIVLAIGTAALGKDTNDADLTRQGKLLYGAALKETAVALRNPTRAKSAAVFAVPRIMTIFEIFFGADANSNTQAKGWLSHSDGELALITSRGPEAYAESDEAHMLFTNARFRPLLSAVHMRKAIVFNEERWKTLPWKGRAKTSNDVLIDIFCEIPGLLEYFDKWSSTVNNEQRKERLQMKIQVKCWSLHFQLETWLTTNPNEVYHPPITDCLIPIQFPNLEIACLTVRYWVIALLIYGTLDKISGIPPTSASTTHPDRPHPRMFARWISRSASYFFQEQYGIMGATAISFPLGNALYWMKDSMAVDGAYCGMIMKSWNDPNLSSAIRDFLTSIKNNTMARTGERVAPKLEELP